MKVLASEIPYFRLVDVYKKLMATQKTEFGRTLNVSIICPMCGLHVKGRAKVKGQRFKLCAECKAWFESVTEV